MEQLEKFTNAITATLRIIDTLTINDMMGLVTFNSTATNIRIL